MASIQKRINKNGTHTWRVFIRRKGLPTFCTSFVTEEDAIEFVRCNEHKYCLDPENFDFDKLRQVRENQFRKCGVI